ncbi:uncharacterized protein V6R79_007108 [Siganus canaliculatus]
MLGGIHTDLLVTVTLLFLSQTGTHCRAENDFSLVTLPDWRIDSEYVTQCLYDGHHSLACDWTRSLQMSSAAGDVAVNVLESVPLMLEGEACLEFWYLAPVAAKGSELRVLLKSSTSSVEIWSSPALPRDSWRQVFVPLNVTEPGTQVVFEAAQAASIEGQVIFKQIGVRRGSCGHQCESNMELWTDESTRCLCSAGQFSCSPSLCPTGQICGPQRGGSVGTSAPGTCTIHSNTDCSTFDGVLFRFMGPCTYTLARTCLPSEAQPTFSVEVVNERNKNSSLPTVQSVIVETGNFRVSLLKKETQRVVVNGVWRKLPLTLGSGAVNIKSNPASVSLGTSFGLSVDYDNAGAVSVGLPPTYSDHVCGLCGNFNHLRGDDFRKPDGTDAEDATALAESWQTEQTNSSCETVLMPNECEPLEEAEYASEQYCGSLLSTTGPFADCLSILGAESYFRGCMASMCSSLGDPAALCSTLQRYADICLEAGVAIPIWRNSTFCPLQCGENSHYNPCANGCPEVCSSLDIVGSCGSCEERCECDSGFKLTGGKCVPAEDCGCWHNGTHYERGETLLEGECEQLCQCMGNNMIQCTTMRCPDNEVCKIRDGVKGCFPFNPATCSVYGDPHYITFDGMAYDFQGGCSYTLATTCGADTAVRFTVIGHNMHPPLQNSTRSKLEAVTLNVDTFYVTLNQSGEVYVNNTHVQPPYSFADANISLWVYKKNNYTVLETTFGIRMMIDGQNRFFLQVDERYKYELCGLCGTYSEHQDDDFITPGGENVSGPFEFGDSWRVGDDNECIAHPNEPRRCNNDEENEASMKCYALLGEAFQTCHKVIHPSIYISSCVSDYCATSGDLNTLCESLKSYAAACEVAGVKLPPWQTGTACSDPPTTTASPVTTPAPASSTPDQSFCPINCNFEKNLCGWEQLVQDSFDWTRNSGPTPSQQTGPKQDHTTGAGSYMYIEGDSITHGDSARLLSSMCHYHGPVCLHFWYNMYGSATAMALNIYLLKDNKATKLWSMRNNQGPEWYPAHIDISMPGPFQIIMEGIRGSTAESDIAIDDISIQFGSCSGSSSGLVGAPTLPSTTVEVFPSHPVCSVDCTFDSNICNWNQMITDAFDWTLGSGSTPTMMTGPSTDHTGDGHYLYIEASSVTHGDTARLISVECSDSGPQCLQFWYHMYGSADTMGLHVYLLQNKLADAIWWKRNDQGNLWKLAQVDFTTIGAFQIIIEGRRGSNEESDVAIDDIKLYRGRCSDLSGAVTSPLIPTASTEVPPSVPVPTTEVPELHSTPTVQLPVTTKTPVAEPTTSLTRPPHPACQLQCDFERDLCQWSQLLTDVFDWSRHRGSTPTMMTGPSSDHTLGDGYYLYIEANSATHGDTARLISSECSDSGPQCLQFWYHMYGSADTMGLHVYMYQDAKAERIWWKRNNQENMWRLAQVDLNTTGAFQIIFEGRRGSNDQSDVAVDDLSLHRGPCADLTNPTTPTTTAVTGLQTTVHPESSTTAEPLPPTTDGGQPQTTVQPQPPTTDGPQPPTTAQPQPPTTDRPQPPTTAQPQPPTTDRPQPPITDGPQIQTTAHPQPPTTVQPQSQTTAHPQPPITDGPQAETTVQPQPQTTAHPQPPTTDGPQAETTVQPQPQTTAHPQPPTTDGPQAETTVQPQPPATDGSQAQTTAHPQPPTTGEPQPPTTDGPQPSDGPQAETTVQPQPQTTAHPQPPTTDGPQAETTVQPQPPATDGSQVETTVQPQPPTTDRPQPPTTDGPKPPTTVQPQPPTTDGTQVETTVQPQPPTTDGPQPPTTDGPKPPTTVQPQPPTTDGPQPQTTGQPQPPTTDRPQSPTTAQPQPQTTVQPQPQTTVQPQPPTTDGPKPQTIVQPQPPTTDGPQPPTTDRPQAEITVQPQSPTTDGPQPQTTVQPQPPTTDGPQPPTTDGPQPPSTVQPQPPTTDRPQPPTTDGPQAETTVQPQPQTTAQPQVPTTDRPQPQTTAHPQPPTTNGPQPQTTAWPQPQTTVQPQPPTTDGPQPPTSGGPQPETTAKPQPPTTDEPTTAVTEATTASSTTDKPTTPMPTPLCPSNSHYTTCIPACSPTCAYVNGPPHCSHITTCVSGCVCNEGFVQKGQVCVPLQECGCIDRNGAKYQFNEVWYTEHCSQKCECEKRRGVGRIDCDDKDECDRNGVCLQNEEGDYYCQATGFNECTVKRDSEYRTFDEMRYDFDGDHSYVLVRTKNLPNNLPAMYIEGINTRKSHDDDDDDDDDDSHHHHGDSSSEEDDSHRDSDEDDKDDDEDDDHKHSHGHEGHHRLQELKIRVYNHTVELKKRRNLVVDGKDTDTPASPAPGLNIYQHHSRIYLKTDFGLTVEFDGDDTAEIVLPRIYKRRVGGLCGNFDDDRRNEWTKPDGSRARNVREFVESWRV